MNNIKKPNIFIYIGLLLILVILILLIIVFPMNKSKQKSPTSITPIPSKSINVTDAIISPTRVLLVMPSGGTGANTEIPKNIADAATQKQNLKKILPLQQPDFTITFDYATDKFIVTLSEPITESKKIFLSWSKINYPLISLSKFNIK